VVRVCASAVRGSDQNKTAVAKASKKAGPSARRRFVTGDVILTLGYSFGN